MLDRLRQALSYLACTCWITCGLSLPLLLMLSATWTMPSVDISLLTAGCLVLTAATSLVRYEFRHGDKQLEVSPDSAFVVLAAVALSPPVASLVAVAGGWRVLRRARGWNRLFVAATMSLSAGAASIAVHAAFGSGLPQGREVLPAALLAALVRELLVLLGRLMYEEARESGGGAVLARNTPVVALALLEVGLPVSAVALAGPFLGTPPAALAVVMMFAGFTWIVLRLLHAEFRHRRQNDYLRDTVSRYMPGSVASELLRTGDQAELGGEQREITVMFCDIRNFTTWSEQNEPNDLIAELNKLLTLLADAVTRTDGTLDKFTGDGIMAFWGAPGTQPDHAARAMKAVPQILMRVRELNMQREAAGKPALEVGIGINTGLAMVGNVGHRDRLNYTAVGDTVNLAARLEAQTKDAGCAFLVSEHTFLHLPLEMQRQCARLESTSVKGRRGRVRLYTLAELARYRTPPAA